MGIRMAVLLGTALVAAGCGAEQPAAAPLEGSGWIGTPIDPARPAEKIRVLAFFKPG